MNGWTNHATWMLALHLQEGGEEFAESLAGRLSDDGAYSDREILEEFVMEFIHAELSVNHLGAGTLVQDIVQSFISDVNWYEIAKLVKDTLGETTEKENAE